MNNRNDTLNPTLYSRVAGLLYLSIILMGSFSLLYFPLSFVVVGDGATTANNITASESMARFSIVTALVNQIVNIILALVLYKLLKPASKTHAVFMVAFFLVSVPITMFNEVSYIAVVVLASSPNYLNMFTPEQLHGLVFFFIELHEYGIHIAALFWGLWLFPMGYSIFRSGYLPKFLGILLMIACFGYLFDSLVALLFPNFAVTVVQFTFIGEPALTLWLLFKGVNVEQLQKQTLKTV